jgi:hypothetical protein
MKSDWHLVEFISDCGLEYGEVEMGVGMNRKIQEILNGTM